jgi:hypothetical protein
MDGVKSVTWFGGMLIFNGIVYYTITVCTGEAIIVVTAGAAIAIPLHNCISTTDRFCSDAI